MSTKELHTLGYWLKQCRKLNQETGQAFTAGQLAKAVGQSTNTAKKYLKKLVSTGEVRVATWTFPNGVIGKIYAVREVVKS